ncbi:MAG: hypothetical protein KDA37_18555 [Planctomycetales bacterium]|nr:hypothetical protein [Planctomycetales bacterium]
MVQTAFIFVLGFLAALLLGLMAAPTVWRRAVYLTRRRIEAALPLTANELYAEKDKLRAEHAMEVRPVELQLHNLREADTAQKVLIEEQADKLKDFEAKLAASEKKSIDMRGEMASLTDRAHELTTELSETSILLESTRTELDMRTGELKSALRKVKDREAEMEEGAAELKEAAKREEVRKSEIAERDKRIAELESALGARTEELQEANGELQVRAGRLEENAAELKKAAVLASAQKSEIAERDARIEDLNATLAARVDDLKKANRELDERARKLEENAVELRNAAQREAAQKSDISERDAYIRKINVTIAELKHGREELQRGLREMNAKGTATGTVLATERKRYGQVEAKLERVIAANSVLEEKLERREADIQRAREDMTAGARALREMEARAMAAERENKRHESHIAAMTLRIDGLRETAFGEKGRDQMVEELQARMAQQWAAFETLEEERDAIQQQLADAKSAANGDTAAGDAVLREKLNQLAAEVVAMAARIEGPQSRINTLVGDEASVRGDVVSLAERIKALQRAQSAQRGSA